MRRRLLTGTRISPDRNHTADGHDFPNANRKAGQPVYYRGKYKIFAVLTQLVARVQPTEALLAGGSAGGMAVYHHYDRAAAILATQSTPLRCMPDAGLFPGSDWRVPNSGNSWVAGSMESKPGVNAECVAAYERNRSDWKVCYCGAAALRFIKTPTSILNSLYNWCTAFFLVHSPAGLWWQTGQENAVFLQKLLTSYIPVVLDALAPAIAPLSPHGVFEDTHLPRPCGGFRELEQRHDRRQLDARRGPSLVLRSGGLEVSRPSQRPQAERHYPP